MERHPTSATFSAGLVGIPRRIDSAEYPRAISEPRQPSLDIVFNDGKRAIYFGAQAAELMQAIQPWLEAWPNTNAGPTSIAIDSLLYPARHPCPYVFDDLAAPSLRVS